MILGLDKKIVKLVLDIVDKKLGKLKIGGITIDKITDIFQGQDSKIKSLEIRLDALEYFLKEKNE